MELELAQGQRNKKISDWFAQYGKRVLAFVRSRISDLEMAEDVAQDVWLQLTRQDDLEAIGQIGNWLFATARNRVTDMYRKKKNVPFSQLMPAGSTEESDDSDANGNLFFDNWAEQFLPDSWIESREFWEELHRALDQIPPEQREVFVAHELNDIPFKQMAADTGLPVNTLLARKRYAVLYLRKYFAGWAE